MNLNTFVEKIRGIPPLSSLFRDVSRVALEWCASADASLREGKELPEKSNFDQRWKALVEKAKQSGIALEEGEVLPHDLTRIIAR